MLIFSLCIEGISWVSTYLPLLAFTVCEFISHIIVWSFCCLRTETINYCHLVIHKFFRLCGSCWCSKWKLRRSRLFTFLHFAKARVDLSIGEFNEILIVIYFFLLLLLRLYFCHIINYVTNFENTIQMGEVTYSSGSEYRH